jgi:hypothetical protein
MFWSLQMHNLPPHATLLAASTAPIAKVNNPAIVTMGGAVMVWVAKTYFKTEIPAEVAIAVLGLLSYVVAYITPLKRREVSV